MRPRRSTALSVAHFCAALLSADLAEQAGRITPDKAARQRSHLWQAIHRAGLTRLVHAQTRAQHNTPR